MIDITNKFWQLCHHLRHDGVDSSDYIEQLTYLLFLKMADEKKLLIPNECGWQTLSNTPNEELVNRLNQTLNTLQKENGLLGAIFQEPVSRITKAESLRKIIQLINTIEWSKIDADVIGIAFEELIGRVANDGKKGAGQYFTPRPLIQMIVNVMKPNPFKTKNFKLADVAVGTSGFLTISAEWIKQNYPKEYAQKQEKYQHHTFYGQELVKRPHRLALMNLFLHGIDGSETIMLGDSIEEDKMPNDLDMIISNPPFGNKGAAPVKRKFPIKTSDKQLNFLQLIIEKLKIGGKAAIVLPDSCLSSEAAKKIWAYYLDKEKSQGSVCNLHTVIKLPEGIFAAYANGVKACVIFLDKGKETENLWMYDARKNVQKVTTKSNPLTSEHFADFEKCFFKRKETDKFKSHNLCEIQEKGFDLSFNEIVPYIKLPHSNLIIDEMIADLYKQIDVLQKMKV
ncbi:MAG: type I restriction-modification system subunit M [Bacteroidia bacterium]|nr:type I restriction-modification system subunit M [Bacteroidia bacterium]